jgi:hypothetical protein
MALKWLIVPVVVYGAFVAHVAQRSVQYFPERRRTAPWAGGLPEREEVVLATADGKRAAHRGGPHPSAKPFVQRKDPHLAERGKEAVGDRSVYGLPFHKR